MRFLQDIFAGFGAYGKGFRFMRKNGLMWYFIFPLALNIIVYFAGSIGVDFLSDSTSELVKESLKGWTESWGDLGWLDWLISGFFFLVFQILWFFIFGFVIGAVILMLLSPVFAVLSEKTEKLVLGVDYPFNLTQLIKDTLRGIGITIRNFIYQNLSWLLIFLLSLFIPIIGQLMGFVLGAILVSYFYGFSFLDYTNERRRFKVKDSIGIIRKYKGVAIGLGLVFYMILLIPFLGRFIAPFVALIGTVGATLFLLQQEEFKDGPKGFSKGGKPRIAGSKKELEGEA